MTKQTRIVGIGSLRVKKSAASVYSSLYLSIVFFSQVKISFVDFSTSVEAWVFKHWKHLQINKTYCLKENHAAAFYLYIVFLFFFISFILPIVIHREFCVNISLELLHIGS